MKKVRETLSSLFIILALLAVGFGSGFAWCHWYEAQQQTTVAVVQAPTDGLHFPGEAEKVVVTRDEIEAVLDEIREFATYSGVYTVRKTEDVWRCVDDFSLPGTRNTVSVCCQGVVKAGFDVDQIDIEVDSVSETVYIRLPQVEVLDNYVIVDSVDASGSVNNPLNPLSFDQYRQVIVSVEEEGLAQVTRMGIFELAEESFRHIVTQCLAGATDYRIVFL